MKKNVSVLMAILLMLVCTVFPVNAELQKSEFTDLNSKVEEMLMNVGYSGLKFNVETLYDNNNNPAYYLGYSENGYIIIEIESWVIHECGELNPYSNEIGQKYYSGPLNYYLKSDGSEYINLITREVHNDVPVSSHISVEENEKYEIKDNTRAGTTGIVTNASAFLLRKAFGKNVNGTCGAVAVQLALNYLTLQKRISFVPTDMRSEDLSGTSYSAPAYPKAKSMHDYLVNMCQMGIITYGSIYVNSFNNYVASKAPNTGLSMTYSTIWNITSVKNNINNDKPVLITTTFTGGEYDFHNMVVYGYDQTSGTCLLLCHTGWYSYLTGSGSSAHHSELYLNPSYATYVYYIQC